MLNWIQPFKVDIYIQEMIKKETYKFERKFDEI